MKARRLALLIGNKDYSRRPLTNPVNDATDLGAVLKEAGFETSVVTNSTLQGMETAVKEFAARVRPGDAVLFHFSGHGIEVGGQNYLLPVDFDADTEDRVKHRAQSASEVLDLLKARGGAVTILVLDACRDNPYKSWRSGRQGLTSMGARGAYVAFAAAPGGVADDNRVERNGLFT